MEDADQIAADMMAMIQAWYPVFLEETKLSDSAFVRIEFYTKMIQIVKDDVGFVGRDKVIAQLQIHQHRAMAELRHIIKNRLQKN